MTNDECSNDETGASTETPLILFDGVCIFCNASVNFIIRRDRKKRFRFAAIQSAVGQRILKKHGLPSDWVGSVVLVDSQSLSFQSDAALRIVRHLNAPWPMLYALRIIPRFLRDVVYDFIARRRYRWFGKKETCSVPTEEASSRFLL